MTEEEFIEQVDGAPYGLDEIAEIAAKVTDNDTIKECGENYLSAMEDLFSLLDELEVELG